MACPHSPDGSEDRRGVARRAKLGHEPAARDQRGMHTGDHRVRIATHPMQRSIGEDRVLRLGDAEVVAVTKLEGEIGVIGPGLGNHLR